jgi:integrase
MSNRIISRYLNERDYGKRANAPRIKLTSAIVDALPTKPYDYAIGELLVPGLSVRVRKDTGTKTFEVIKKVNGRMARSKVCTVGERPYARGDESVIVTARAIIAKMDKGITRSKEKAEARARVVERVRSSLTVMEACTTYIQGKTRASATTAGYKRFRDNHLADWHHKQLSTITEDDIADLHGRTTENTGPVAANNVVRFFRSVWKFHRRRLGLGECPTIIFTREGDSIREWNAENRRTRYIHREELEPWWAATERLREEYIGNGDLAADYLQFALLTGLRRREITGIRWENINTRRRTLLISDNKSKRPHTIPLTLALEDILDRRKREPRPFQIDEPKRFITQVSEWSNVPFSSHDLRRTFLSHATAVAVPETLQKAMVNHSRKGVTDGYIQVDEDILREAMQKVQTYILTHAGQVNDVVPMEIVNG